MANSCRIHVEKVSKVWLSTREAAEYLGMSKDYISNLRRLGLLPHSMIGNSAFFRKKDIDDLLEKNLVY